VDWRDMEGVAVSAYERHRLDPSQPASTLRIARLELGPDAIVRAPLTISGPAATFWHKGLRRIAVKRGLAPPYLRFVVGHELGHHLLEREGYVGDDIEAACDYLGAALMAPRAAVIAIYREHGLDFGAAASVAGSTQTWAALRLGEVLSMPLAAVSPQLVRVRGPEAWVWPEERTIRAWARRPGPGLRRVPITDGRGRLALLAEGE